NLSDALFRWGRLADTTVVVGICRMSRGKWPSHILQNANQSSTSCSPPEGAMEGDDQDGGTGCVRRLRRHGPLWFAVLARENRRRFWGVGSACAMNTLEDS